MDYESSGDCIQLTETTEERTEKGSEEKSIRSSPINRKTKPLHYNKNPTRKHAQSEPRSKASEASSNRVLPEERKLEKDQTQRHSARRAKSGRQRSGNLEKTSKELSKVKYSGSFFAEGKPRETSPAKKQNLAVSGNPGPIPKVITNTTVASSREQAIKVAVCLCMSILVGCGVGTGIGYGVVSLLKSETATEDSAAGGSILTRVNDTSTSNRLPGTETFASSGRTTNVVNQTARIIPDFEFPRDCGRRSRRSIEHNRVRRIVGGTQANISDYPWQASMWTDSKHTCGGSIIASKWILSAAHCTAPFPRPSSWTIYLGASHQDAMSTDAQRAVVTNVITHEAFDEDTYENDIALLRLSTEIIYNSQAQPICLPSVNYRLDWNSTLSKCNISGWGALKEGEETTSNLHHTEVTFFEHAICNSNDWLAGMVYNNMICAGAADGSKDACQGDSGGPLSCFDEGNMQFYLVGIVSWGVGCGVVRMPGVYTNVSQYIDWITSKINEVEASISSTV